MFRKLTLLGILLTLAVMVAGSFAKLSGAELAFDSIQPHELHVKSAYGLAAVTFVLLVMSWWQTHCRLAAITTAFGLTALLGVQVALGITVITSTKPAILLTGHLLLAMTLFWTYFWLYLRTEHGYSRTIVSGPLWFARIAILLLLVQIVLGSWVSVNHATLACIGFPQCNGQWWPDADYLSMLQSLITPADYMSPETQVAANWLHRVVALVCFVLFNILMLVATSPKNSKSVRKAGLWLSFLLFIQVGLGVVGYKFAMPMWIILGHTAFAALLMLPLIAISFYSRYSVTELKPVTKEARPEIDKSDVKLAPKISVPETIRPKIAEDYVEPAPESLYLRLKTQLSRTRTGLGGILGNLQIGQRAINDELLEEIEASLLMADVGIDVTTKIINRLTQGLERQQLSDSTALSQALKQELYNILIPCSMPLTIPKQDKPFVILVVGVNGVGKTTTIGKLAKRLKAQGHSVMLAAGDTFRAAAVEQLQTWGERNDIHVVAQHTGADSASVIYDGIQSAQSKGVDILIADTAGRLHTKDNLMEELKKVKRIMAKLDESAPHEVILVLDAGTGQNALSQAKLFNEAVGLTGLVLTKLDGTAKGGVIFALAKQSGIPIRFIGVGEGIDDLQDFNAETFIDALFVKD